MKRLLAALALSAALAGTSVAGGDSASAWRYEKVTGTRGSVAVPAVQYGIHYQVVPCGGGTCSVPMLQVLMADTLTVNRVPNRAGAQTVAVMYVLQKWNGNGWAVVTHSRAFTAVIGRYAQSVEMPQWNVYLNANQSQGARGYWRLRHLLSWSNGNDSVSYGTAIVGPSRYGDQYCSRPNFMGCRDYGEYLYVHQVQTPS